MSEHTPPPWDRLPGETKEGHPLGAGRLVIDIVKRRVHNEIKFVRVARLEGEGALENAVFIVRAANSHDALVEALTQAAKTFRHYEFLHRAKPDNAKADANADKAAMCEAALKLAGVTP